MKDVEDATIVTEEIDIHKAISQATDYKAPAEMDNKNALNFD